MKSQALLPLPLFSLLILISACTSTSPDFETQTLIDSIPSLEERLGTGLRSIDAGFQEYDSQFSAIKVVNLLVITDSFITGMEKNEKDILESLSQVEEEIAQFNLLRVGAQVSSLPKESMDIVNSFESNRLVFNSNKGKIENCLDKMGEYRHFVVLSQENLELTELFTSQTIKLEAYASSGQTNEAVLEVIKIQDTINKVKANTQSITETGVQKFSQETMDSHDALHNAYEIYKQHLVEQDEYKAEELYLQYSKDFSNAIAMVPDDEASISATANEIDEWYQINIGVCLNVFDGT